MGLLFEETLISVFDLDPSAMSRDVISIILLITHIILGVLAGLLFFWFKRYFKRCNE